MFGNNGLKPPSNRAAAFRSRVERSITYENKKCSSRGLSHVTIC
jgi:hypothetical protein